MNHQIDIVVGAITNYSFSHIRNWVHSLDRCGFKGQKILLCYNISFDVVEELSQRGYVIFAFKRNDDTRMLEYKQEFNIMRDRFLHMWYFLTRLSNKDDYRYIIATDVKDVIFQRNPSEWLERHMGDKTINVASESIRYTHEAWGNHNLFQSFGPLIHETHKDNIIYNAGTVSGDFQTMLDLFLNIYQFCLGAPAHVLGGGGPDQAALNILLHMKTYHRATRFTQSEEGWAAQLGTTKDPLKLDKVRQYLLEPEPIMSNGLVCTSTGDPYYLVHQYERIPEWKTIIDERYA